MVHRDNLGRCHGQESGCCLVCACSIAAASSSVRVDETGCKILLREAAPVVLLAVDNTAAEAASARIELEWLDKAGVVRSSKETLATIYPGRSSIRVPMDLVADSPWYRLRYRVRPAGGESTGILSLGVYIAFDAGGDADLDVVETMCAAWGTGPSCALARNAII
jgi:hypothetical protein